MDFLPFTFFLGTFWIVYRMINTCHIIINMDKHVARQS